MVSTNSSSTALSVSRRSVQCSGPSGGSEQARAVIGAAVRPARLEGFPDRGFSSRLFIDFSSKKTFAYLMISVHADLECFCYLLVCFPGIGRQQNAGACDFPGQFAPEYGRSEIIDRMYPNRN